MLLQVCGQVKVSEGALVSGSWKGQAAPAVAGDV